MNTTDYDEMREIQRVRQAEITAWRATQDLSEARDLEVHSINRAQRPETNPVIPPLNEPIEDEDTSKEVSTPAVDVSPKPSPTKAKPTVTKPVS